MTKPLNLELVKLLQPKTDVEELYEYLEAIPDNMWRTGSIGDRHSPRCFVGHCMSRCGKDTISELNARMGLEELMHKLSTILGKPVGAIPINDGVYKRSFPQKTPKARVLAALKLIIDHEAKK
jgi:hypothetical protein